jgi:hypothetical protein
MMSSDGARLSNSCEAAPGWQAGFAIDPDVKAAVGSPVKALLGGHCISPIT